MFRIVSLFCAAVVMVGIEVPSAVAQQAQAVGFDLFTRDGVDPNPDVAAQFVDAARKAEAPDGCILGRIAMFVPEVAHANDPIFWNATAAARRDVILQLLNVNGIEPSRFFFDVIPLVGDNTDNDSQLEYSPSDNDPPRLTVTSMPEKGKKVVANQRITVKAIASDDANNWQTGIKSIDLTSEGGGPFGFQDYSQPPTTCQSPPPPRTLEGVYGVPANPPPLVRLRATAKDFAGNEIDLLANFPTGDWYGNIIKKMNGGGHNHTVTVRFAFDLDASGTIKGRANAGIRTEEGVVPGCTLLWTYEPSEFDLPLSGRRDGPYFEIMLEPHDITQTIAKVAGACEGGQESGTSTTLNPAVYATTKYRISAQEGATNTVNLSAGALPWGMIMSDTITIHQARQ